MKPNKKKKVNLLQNLLTGKATTTDVMRKPLAKIYREFSNRPGQYFNHKNEPRTKQQIEEECRFYTPFIVTVVVPEGRQYRIAGSESEIED